MKGKPVLTLPMLNSDIAAAQASYDAEKTPENKAKLNKSRAALREFIYHSKSLGGKCSMIRH